MRKEKIKMVQHGELPLIKYRIKKFKKYYEK